MGSEHEPSPPLDEPAYYRWFERDYKDFNGTLTTLVDVHRQRWQFYANDGSKFRRMSESIGESIWQGAQSLAFAHPEHTCAAVGELATSTYAADKALASVLLLHYHMHHVVEGTMTDPELQVERWESLFAAGESIEVLEAMAWSAEPLLRVGGNGSGGEPAIRFADGLLPVLSPVMTKVHQYIYDRTKE